MSEYRRWQYNSIKSTLQDRRILLLSGSRQCGKTTLAKALAHDDVVYQTLDYVPILEAAREDPHGFVSHGDELMIIDEVQREPRLLQAIKADVDINKKPGRFLLTGSANIRTLPHVSESLAGRVSTIRLRSLVQGELHDRMPQFLEHAFEETFYVHQPYSKDDYLTLALSGGYPEALALKDPHKTRKWHKDYIKALIEKDLHDITHIRRKDAMMKLLECLAAWSSKLIDITEIGAGLSIQRPTIESYLNALETLYLVERLQPWLKTDYDRVGRKEKLFLTDTGLMSSLLKWDLGNIRLDGERNGKLLESFVFTELAAIIDAQSKPYEFYHYRDRIGREIDFLIEDQQGRYLGIEVKAGTSISAKSFKHLKWFKDTMVKGHRFIGIVLYTGNDVLRFGPHMWAVPISSLWGTKSG